MKDRTGQRIKINDNPDIVYEVTRWHAGRELWQAKCVVPDKKLMNKEYREDFLQWLDEHNPYKEAK